jgi:nitrogen regulatory protein P-II 2
VIKIQALIREERLPAVVERLRMIGVRGLTVTYAHSFYRTSSRISGNVIVMRGREYRVPFAPRLIVEWWGPERCADSVVRAIERSAATGQQGDGNIVISTMFASFGGCAGDKAEDPF